MALKTKTAVAAIATFCAWCVGEKPDEGFCMIADCPLRAFSPYQVGVGAETIGGWDNPHLQVQLTQMEAAGLTQLKTFKSDKEVAE